MRKTRPTLDELCVNTIRTLSIDAVQRAQSGHPGTPMDPAPTVYCLWQRFLAFDPHDPDWPNRDRFVLSVGPRRGSGTSGTPRRRPSNERRAEDMRMIKPTRVSGSPYLARVRPLDGAGGGWVYGGRVPAIRPATDDTARVIPQRLGVAVPLEAAHIVWQR